MSEEHWAGLTHRGRPHITVRIEYSGGFGQRRPAPPASVTLAGKPIVVLPPRSGELCTYRIDKEPADAFPIVIGPTEAMEEDRRIANLARMRAVAEANMAANPGSPLAVTCARVAATNLEAAVRRSLRRRQHQGGNHG